MKVVGEICNLYISYPLANPILRVDELREDFDDKYDVKSVKGLYRANLVRDPTGEKGNLIDTLK